MRTMLFQSWFCYLKYTHATSLLELLRLTYLSLQKNNLLPFQNVEVNLHRWAKEYGDVFG